MIPGFSERTFEFCFNSEYCQRNAAMLATHPHIPSQNAEKDLGYDVEFRINQGNFTRSVFIQHKVSAFAEKRAGRNAQFFDSHNGPYFRFPIDNHQHSTLFELSRDKGNAFYCAPMFNLSHQLEANFRANSINSNSILLDPLDVGDVPDLERHNITYGPNGQNPTLHSEARRFNKSYRGGEEEAPLLREQKIDPEYVEELSETLVRRSARPGFEGDVPKDIENARPIERVQLILARVFEVSWILLP